MFSDDSFNKSGQQAGKDAMILKNNRRERFCQLVASGKSQSDAYREVYPRSMRWKEEAIHVRASELAGKVSVRVGELKEAGATRAVMTKIECCELLSKIIRSPDGDGGGMVSRLAAIGILSKMMGFYAPEKIEQTQHFPPDEKMIAFLRDRLEKIRAKK